MIRTAGGRLTNLLTTTEPVSHDPRVLRRLPYGWQEHSLADIKGHTVMSLVETKRARHSAAAGIENLCAQASRSQGSCCGLSSDDRALVTMDVHE